MLSMMPKKMPGKRFLLPIEQRPIRSPSKMCQILAFLAVVATTLSMPAQGQGFDAQAERQLVQLINQARSSEGLPALTVDPRLTEAARKHTALMVAHKEPAHQYDGETALQFRFADQNLRSDRQGENVAVDVDAAGAHGSLMRSSGHRANILSRNYNAVGVGVFATGENIYVTEDFANRLPDYTEHQADAALQRAVEKYASTHGMAAPVRKQQTRLHAIACKLALNDGLDNDTPLSLPGVHRVMEWTETELERLPPKAEGLLAQPLPGGYSMGVCFARSVSHPGGVYWVVMVLY